MCNQIRVWRRKVTSVFQVLYFIIIHGYIAEGEVIQNIQTNIRMNINQVQG